MKSDKMKGDECCERSLALSLCIVIWNDRKDDTDAP